MTVAYHPERPLTVQGDRGLLLEVDNPLFSECRERLAAFAELRKTPEHVHFYAITPLSLWNASAAGVSPDDVHGTLQAFSKYDVPARVLTEIRDVMGRYGKLRLLPEGPHLSLESRDEDLLPRLQQDPRVRPLLLDGDGTGRAEVAPGDRGRLKQALLKAGFPVEDLVGYTDGTPLPLALMSRDSAGQPFGLRDYQREAVDAFWAEGGPEGGNGVLMLPCGAGKTVIGMGVMERASCHTLVLCTSTAAVHQWQRELVDKMEVDPADIGEYTGHKKEIRPITLATYQIMTSRARGKGADFPHLGLFMREDWGLILYDEVHLLPAPVFRVTAEIQSRRRLGLTATLVREDNREDDVFSLIGPKRCDAPWRQLEEQGWIAPATCTEVRVPLSPKANTEYAAAEGRDRYRVAAANPAKLGALEALLERHRGGSVLVIGMYLDQLEAVAERLRAPIVTGGTPVPEREVLYDAFRRGEEQLLVVSRVANFAIDLPEANVAIEISGLFGSRQEEAQRFGRILRPKPDGGPAHFYALVTGDSDELRFSDHRQLFLTEQGYRYEIEELQAAP